MEHAIDGLTLAAATIIVAIVITMAVIIAGKGTTLFNEHTEDVNESAQAFSKMYTRLYDDTTVTTADVIAAAQEYADNFEIRYQTLWQRDSGIDYVVYPGTEQDGHVAVSWDELKDTKSMYYLNPEATWHAVTNEDDAFILFRQEEV